MLFNRKRFKHKVFDYQPQFYKPEEDQEEIEKERKKRRFKAAFNNERSVKRTTRSPIYFITLLLIIIYVYLKLAGLI